MNVNRFTRSLSAEAKKLVATKMWWIMALVLFLYAALMAGTFAALFGTMPDIEGAPNQGAAGSVQAQMIYSTAASFGYAVPLLFGAIMATTEMRHRVLSLAFIAEPKREVVLVSKLLTLSVAGIFLGFAGVLASVGVGAATYVSLGGQSHLFEAETWWLIIRTVLVIALWALIGFGLGLVLRNQAVTIVVALIFTQFLEPMLRVVAMFWDWSASLAKVLPGAATDAFIGVSILGDMSALDPEAPELQGTLTVWQGGLVLVGYAILVGWIIRWRRDVQ